MKNWLSFKLHLTAINVIFSLFALKYVILRSKSELMKNKEEALDVLNFQSHLLTDEEFSVSLSANTLPVESSGFRSDRISICICTQGVAECEVNMTPLSLCKYQLLAIFPNQKVTVKYTSTDFSVLYLSFSSQFMNEVVFHFPPNLVNFIRDHYTHKLQKVEFDFFYDQHFRILRERFENKRHICRREIITNLLRNYFLDVYDRIKRNETLQASSKNRKNELMEQFCMLVMSDFRICREVGYYADKLFITPKYLSKIVKEQDVNNRSAKEWIDDYTITEIKMLLKYSSTTIQEIANDLHFPNSSFLCKYFKSRTGMTPKEFKRRLE